MSVPRITAVVVVHGSPAAVVAACMDSLLDSVDVDVHIVLVDNASPDGGAAWLAQLDAAGLSAQTRAEAIPVELWRNLTV